MTTISWLDQIAGRGVVAVARAVGLTVAMGGGSTNLEISPCPSCGAGKRARHDNRGPIGVRPDDLAWRCQLCDAHGDPLNLASWALLGTCRPNGIEWAELQTACADAGLCDAGPRRRPPARARDACDRSVAASRPQSRAVRPVRPPAAEVTQLWAACQPVTQDTEVAQWLAQRGLEPERCAARDLVRALPLETSLPAWARAWARSGRSWTKTGHRIIIPLYGSGGQLETLYARAIASRARKGQDQVASPKGAQVSGTVMADHRGLALLGRSVDTSNATHGTHVLREMVTILIAEEILDYLTWATHFDEDDHAAPAVLGITAESWTDAIAGRIPDGVRVLIRTHEDETGDMYARRISNTLRQRCQVYCRPSIASQGTT